MRTTVLTRKEWDAMTLYQRFEQLVSWVLTLAISAVIVVALVRLVHDVVDVLVIRALIPLEHQMFQQIFGAIMTLLIALEFGHSILHASGRSWSVIQVSTVILIALLAVTRKLIILDISHSSTLTLLALGATVLALGAAYWLLRARAVSAPDE